MDSQWLTRLACEFVARFGVSNNPFIESFVICGVIIDDWLLTFSLFMVKNHIIPEPELFSDR